MADDAAPAAAPPGPLLKGPLAGIVFLPFLAYLPASLIFTSLAAYSKAGVGMGVLLLLGSAVPAVGIALNRPWGLGGARYIAFFGIIVAMMMGLSECWPKFDPRAISITHYAHLALFVAVLAALGSDRVVYQPREETDEDRPDEDSPRWLKENAEALIVAFVMALIIRCFCLEVFMIPSSSMFPTLNGAEKDGDRIMVTKFYTALTNVERFDVMVFKFPLNQVKNFIKRVVGLPGEDFFIAEGNVYFHKLGDPDPRFRIGRRPLRIQRSIWVDTLGGRETLGDKHEFQQWWEAATPRGTDSPAPYDVSKGRLTVREEAGRRASRFLFDRRNRFEESSDMTIGANVTLNAGTAPFYLSIENDGGSFTFSAAASGESSLTWKADGEKKVAIKRELGLGREHRLELHVYDGIAVAMIDGEVAGELEFIATYDDLKAAHSGRQMAFGSEGTTYELSRLFLGHDIHYRPDGHIQEGPQNKITIPPGNYVMMGDHVNNSHDSRKWIKITFKEKDGHEINSESIDVIDDTPRLRDLAKERRLASTPDHWVRADEYGIEHILYNHDLDGDQPRRAENFTFVNERFLVGKALWIWWPPPRAGRLIR